jgi:S-adenosylmethionine-dependent methyltransferase
MVKAIAKRVNDRLENAIIGDLSKNWHVVGQRPLDMHRDFIRKNYIHPARYWESHGGKADLEGLAIERLKIHRRTYVPWLNSLFSLRGSKILEIGAGTGSSTVAMAEQGAEVIGIDILEQGISVAKDKCRAFGVHADFVVGNFLDYSPQESRPFDAVIFFASLEHMLLHERLEALPHAWDIIKPGGYLIVIEAPNRLWFYDEHTSHLPFFNWLPPQLALHYMKFSPRAELVDLLSPPSEANLLELCRWGLGVSFHEFDLSLGPDIRNAVVSSLRSFLRSRSPLRYIGWHVQGHARFARFLNARAAEVPRFWFEPYLDLAIRRP